MNLRLLVVTTLYPNSIQCRHGIFVETRLLQLLKDSEIEGTVIAPVPWFPFNLKRFPEYSSYRRVPGVENRHGIKVYHPRYLVIPKIGMLLTPFTLAISIARTVSGLRKQGMQFDVVDSHYYYPDGVAIAILARLLRSPFTVTARGTDINLIADFKLPRWLILWAARKAAASITVCAALKSKMVELGAEPQKIHVLRNGVDLELFHPLNRDVCRKKYQLTGKTLLSVGHLIERKGHDLVIKALSELPDDYQLLIAGDGREERNLKDLAERLGLQDRVSFLGAVTQNELVETYNAADILVLASSREGWANVLLEAMACGTPVVATNIWGTPEVVQSAEAGRLMQSRTVEDLVCSVQELMSEYPDRVATRRYAERFSWHETVRGLKVLFGSLSREMHRKPEHSEMQVSGGDKP